MSLLLLLFGEMKAIFSPRRVGVISRLVSGPGRVVVRNFADFKELYGPFVNGNYELPDYLKENSFAVTSPSTSEHLCNVISPDEEYVDRVGQ